MVTINHVKIKHVKSGKNQYIYQSQLVPPRQDSQLLAALRNQYKIIHSIVKGDQLHVQVDER